MQDSRACVGIDYWPLDRPLCTIWSWQPRLRPPVLEELRVWAEVRGAGSAIYECCQQMSCAATNSSHIHDCTDVTCFSPSFEERQQATAARNCRNWVESKCAPAPCRPLASGWGSRELCSGILGKNGLTTATTDTSTRYYTNVGKLHQQVLHNEETYLNDFCFGISCVLLKYRHKRRTCTEWHLPGQFW